MDNNQIRDTLAKQINSSFDFRKLLAAIMSGWYWFALALALTGTTAYLYLRYTTPVYAVQSTLLVEDKSDIAKNVLSKIDGGGGNSEGNIYNQIFQLRSQDLIAQTVDSLVLNVHYYVKGHIKENEIYEVSPLRVIFDTAGYTGGIIDLQVRQASEGIFEVIQDKNKSRVAFDTWTIAPFGRYKILYNRGPSVNNAYLATGIRVHMEPTNATVGSILGSFKVNITDGRTSMLDLINEDNLPMRGIQFQNALLVFFRRANLANATLSAARTRSFINEQLSNLEGKLQNTDERVADIRRSTGGIDVSQSSTIMAGKTDAERTIDNLMLQRQVVGNLKQSVLAGNGAIVGLPTADPTLIALTNQYNNALLNAEKYKDGPALSLDKENAEAALASTRKRIADAADKVGTTIDYSLKNAYSTEATYSSRLNAVPGVDRSIKDISRSYETQQNLYLMLYQRRLENEISANAMTDRSKVIVAPYSSGSPIRPVRNSIFILAIAVGLILPLSVFAVKEFFNNKLGNEGDITGLTNIPILGSISRNNSGNDIVVGELIRTGIAEQFRLIRANLEFLFSGEQKKVIMITSSISGEGKSFISINLGLTIAIASKRVIIMEFDLRKPKISERLNLSREGGISGYLAGLVGLDKVIKPSGIHPNLYVANCGPIPPNPAELLLLPKTRQLLEDLQEMFDIIVIDTAPIGMVSDAFTLGQYSGVNLIITRQGHTVKEHIKMLETTYHDKKLKNPGIIFNGVEHEKRYGYGYGYGHGYGYGYGYGYGTGGGYYDEEVVRKDKKGLMSLFKKSR